VTRAGWLFSVRRAGNPALEVIGVSNQLKFFMHPHQRRGGNHMIPMSNDDHSVVTQYGTWLQTFHWNLFGTLTFDPAKSLHSSLSRRNLLVQYLNSLERHYKRRIRCFWAEEKRWSGCGRPAIAPHFHLLMACDRRPLAPEYPQQLWDTLGGRAEMRVYDPSLDGAFYCAKLISLPDATYDLVNFPPLASPGLPQSTLHPCR
jgi:hypothetical protein